MHYFNWLGNDQWANLWAGGGAQIIVLLIGVLAIAGAHKFESKHVAIAGVTAPLLAMALSVVGLADNYEQLRILHEFTPSIEPLPPLDQRSPVASSLHNVAPVILAPMIAVVLSISVWVCARVYQFETGLRAVAVGGALVLSVALWGASWWASEFIYQYGFFHYSGCYHGWGWADGSAQKLEGFRALVIPAGVLLGVGSIAVAVNQARRGVTLSWRAWAALGLLLGVAIGAKLWTADERDDTRAYFRLQPLNHGGFVILKGPVADPFNGPVLEHCRFDWPGVELYFVDDDPEPMEAEDLERQMSNYTCSEPGSLEAILADPAVPIARVAPLLRRAEALGRRRLGVAAIRPSVVSRATTGEFVSLHSCVVEFTLGSEGVSLEGFTTWGDLARAADAADGALVVAPPS